MKIKQNSNSNLDLKKKTQKLQSTSKNSNPIVRLWLNSSCWWLDWCLTFGGVVRWWLASRPWLQDLALDELRWKSSVIECIKLEFQVREDGLDKVFRFRTQRMHRDNCTSEVIHVRRGRPVFICVARYWIIPEEGEREEEGFVEEKD